MSTPPVTANGLPSNFTVFAGDFHGVASDHDNRRAWNVQITSECVTFSEAFETALRLAEGADFSLLGIQDNAAHLFYPLLSCSSGGFFIHIPHDVPKELSPISPVPPNGFNTMCGHRSYEAHIAHIECKLCGTVRTDNSLHWGRAGDAWFASIAEAEQVRDAKFDTYTFSIAADSDSSGGSKVDPEGVEVLADSVSPSVTREAS